MNLKLNVLLLSFKQESKELLKMRIHTECKFCHSVDDYNI